MIQEIPRQPINGIPLLILLPLAIIGTAALTIILFVNEMLVAGIGAVLLLIAEFVMLAGFFMVAPNEGVVLQLFGDYRGTARDPGLRWANPFYAKHKVSLRVRNFETGKLKVNDIRGNPIEIGAIVVWRVIDTAEAVFRVDQYEQFVHVQSEAAVRSLATGYAYDSYTEDEKGLVGHTAEVSEKLKAEIQDRLDKAGIEVLEGRISHLAYSPEIAAAMLQRQQAGAVVAARQRIVEGAVGMVETALAMLAEKHILNLDEERRASMVSNLLVVLCSDRHTQPVVNTGSIYS
ncbi:MAG TPA: SPFH domain-containing protein [Thermoanaerobaculia bacterium]